ncbi:ATP-dependent helicase [Corynebacterium phocae]|nr:ATP-dependent helicase [Corynebacterium phocae]
MVSTAGRTHNPRTWDKEVPARGRFRVTGQAGAGVTSFLIDTVIAKIESGADPAGILVISASKESGALLRQELLSRVEDFATGSTLVRSVHSVAFALLRTAEGRPGDSELRLITGAEQDAVIRELLSGHVDSGAQMWPEFIRPALPLVGFARQLRDFLLRSSERGQGPDDLIALGLEWNKPMWTAAGHFLREYERVMALAGHHSLNAAELVAQVAAQPQLTERHSWHTVVVDDAQLLDPNAANLVTALAPEAELFMAGGDPEQAVFAFRGAREEFFATLPEQLPGLETIDLGGSRRQSQPACICAVESQGAQRDVVADLVRRRHLDDQVAYSDIAVIVRGGGEIGQIRRALLAAGVPVHINPTDIVLSEQRLVAAMVQALRALQHPLDNAELEELIVGPVGGADPVAMRRLIRGLRRFAPNARGLDTLRELLDGELPDFGGKLTDREQDILARLRKVLRAGREALGGSIEEVLWAVWDATGLSARLQNAALAGGARGSQADRDLDAIMALFDMAGDYSERYPEADLDAFLHHVEEQELPTGVRDRRVAAPEAVEILSAHGAVGREWDTVIVVGAQEGTWPSLGETGSIFDQEELIDYLDDQIPPGSHVSHLPERLVQERRLFHVATTRHRNRLAIVTVDAPDADTVAEPSRFIEEFFGYSRSALKVQAPGVIDPAGLAVADPLERAHLTVLSQSSFVAQMRRLVTAPDTDEATRNQAARQLARLAAAGVPGAHPEQWWGLREVASLKPAKTRSTVSPSRVEALMNCPLNAVLDRLGEDGGTSIHLIRGNLAHAYLEALGRGVDEPTARALVMSTFTDLLEVPRWKRDFELAEFERLLERTHIWVQASAGSHELVGVEVPVHTRVADGVTIFGFIDRLERQGDEYFIVDLKTGKYPPTSQEAQDNPQLATYQLALANGAFEDGQIVDGEGLKVGGASLVYPATSSKSITERAQSAWEPEELREFAAQLPALVAQLRGPEITAQVNDNCENCLVLTLCPARAEGKMLTDV